MEKLDERPASFRGQKFEGLQVLRLVAAMMIFMCHVDMINAFGLPTYTGADIFFAISGFLVMYTTQSGTRGFLKKRIIRVAPLYWLLTAAAFLASYVMDGITPYRPTAAELVKSLLFIPYSRESIHSESAIRPIIGPAHTLLFEMFFYVVFYIASKISHKRRGEITIAVLLSLMALGELTDVSGSAALVKYSDLRQFDFIYGILLFYVLRYIFEKPKLLSAVRRGSAPILILGCALVCLVAAWKTKRIIVAPLAAVIVFSFAMGFYGRKTPKFLVAAGDMSYSFYLIHYFVVLVAAKLIDPMDAWTFKSVVCAAVSLALSFAAARVSYLVIELKLADFLRSKLIKKGPN